MYIYIYIYIIIMTITIIMTIIIIMIHNNRAPSRPGGPPAGASGVCFVWLGHAVFSIVAIRVYIYIYIYMYVYAVCYII